MVYQITTEYKYDLSFSNLSSVVCLSVDIQYFEKLRSWVRGLCQAAAATNNENENPLRISISLLPTASSVRNRHVYRPNTGLYSRNVPKTSDFGSTTAYIQH